MADSSLYESDIVAWAEEQVEALRRLSATVPSNAVDWANVIEEIESVGRSQVSGVERKLVLIVSHLLKAISAPDSPAVRGWRSEVRSHQRVVRKQFSNAMRRQLSMDTIWPDARDEAADALSEFGDPVVRGLPDRSPIGIDDLVAATFDVDTALSTISKAIRPTGS